jgi:hypothetical protein
MIESVSFLWKTRFYIHLTQGVVFLVFTQIVGMRLQKMIANVPPLLKRGDRGDLRGFLNPPKSPFFKGGLAAHGIP